jgi:GNAT superfamily N-acetyltransferase
MNSFFADHAFAGGQAVAARVMQPAQGVGLPAWPLLRGEPSPAAHEAPPPPPPPTLRRVEPADAEAFQNFVVRLAPASRRMRFHAAISSCSPAMLKALTHLDPAIHQAWVAVQPSAGETAVVGEARFVVCEGGADAELAIAGADDQRGSGLAHRLLNTVVQAAARAAVRVLFADVLEGNSPMFGLMQRHGFRVHRSKDVEAGLVRWQRTLTP